jgi:hypothetical protein
MCIRQASEVFDNGGLVSVTQHLDDCSLFNIGNYTARLFCQMDLVDSPNLWRTSTSRKVFLMIVENLSYCSLSYSDLFGEMSKRSEDRLFNDIKYEPFCHTISIRHERKF